MVRESSPDNDGFTVMVDLNVCGVNEGIRVSST